MVIYGYAKDYKYAGDGTLLVRVRIPQIHGPYRETEYRGKTSRNYVRDQDLPYYTSVILPHLPGEGDVVILSSVKERNQEWVVIGLTGGKFNAGTVNSNR